MRKNNDRGRRIRLPSSSSSSSVPVPLLLLRPTKLLLLLASLLLLLLHLSPHPSPSTTTTATIFVSAQGLIAPGYVSPTASTSCWTPCESTPDSNVAVPATKCKTFYVCRRGRVTNRLACSEGRAFDSTIGACNHEALVECVDPVCPPSVSPTAGPTESPTVSPTNSPTGPPTVSPTVSPTTTPTASPSASPTETPSDSPTVSPTVTPSIAVAFLRGKKGVVERYLLQSLTSGGNVAYPSVQYGFDDFLEALKIMAVDGFGADFRFSLWDDDEVRFRYGLVNVAAFLAQATVEGVEDDTCDELNWQQVAGRYAISNSCGQEGRSYQDESCGFYSCIVDPTLEVTAVSTANDIRSPPPLQCRPGSGPDSYAGYWNTNTGTEIKNTPYSNTAGRIDVEGCCYWGRGVLLTRGSCNIGKLNYFLGARAAREGRRSIYPNIDFCADPEATCASPATKELRWTTALFEWAERVQRYADPEWAYEEELFKFYDEGMTDDSFIDSVSRIFSRGCHAAGCSELDVRMADKRKSNFYLIINDIFAIDTIKLATEPPTKRPSPAPTPRPSQPPLNLFATPQPTPRPIYTITLTTRPTPRPLTPPGQVEQSPPVPRLPPPTNPPIAPLPTVSYPTIPEPAVPEPEVPEPAATYPAISDPMMATPIMIMPIGQPSGNSDSNGQTDETQYPTIIETRIIILEPSGADRSVSLRCAFAIASGVGAIYLLLAMV